MPKKIFRAFGAGKKSQLIFGDGKFFFFLLSTKETPALEPKTRCLHYIEGKGVLYFGTRKINKLNGGGNEGS